MSTALLIIDMQNDFVLADSPFTTGAHAVVSQTIKVLKYFRESHIPIFHIIRQYRSDGSDVEKTRINYNNSYPATPNTFGSEIIKELQPINGEYIIIKNRFSAFMATELDLILRRKNIKDVIICGTQYPNCIRATAFDGISLDYNVTVITDATHGKTPEISQANITDMKNIGIKCITLKEYIKPLC
jgi:nicotinamidase-related amidase